MKFSVFQLSNIGGRKRNEDRMGYSYTQEAALFLLADGMGGHPDGDVAAQMALESLSSYFQRYATPSIKHMQHFLEQGILAAHRRILSHAAKQGMLDSPRTTIVAALVQNDQVVLGHCGDSRAYIVRNHDLLLRTRDHSYDEQRNLEMGQRNVPINRNVLFTCLGSPMRPIIDISQPIPLMQGDKIMLCSDGLWGPLDDDTIVLKLGLRSITNAIPELIDLAMRKGGPRCDNTTAIALEWESRSALDEAEGRISTQALGSNAFATTIQGVVAEADLEALDTFDEEAIERSIAEINEAIRRTAARKKQP